MRVQLIVTALLLVVAALLELLAPAPWPELMLAALGLAYLVAFPGTTLRLMLVAISCDQLLTVHLGESATLRLAHVCGVVLFVRLLATRRITRRPVRVSLRILTPLVLYFAFAIVGALWSESVPKTVGYLGWALFDVLALLTVVLEAARTEAGFALCMRWSITGAALAAAFGLAQLGLGVLHLPVPLAGQRLGEFPRINGFNYEPAYFALYLESVAAVLLGRWLVEGERGRGGAALALGLLIPAALSMSRSGWLGLGLLMGLVVLRLLLGGQRRAAARVIALAGAALCLVAVILPSRFVDEAPRMASMALDAHETSSTAPRLAMLNQAVEIFRRHPLLGVGLGGYSSFITANPELTVHHWNPVIASRQVTVNLWLEILAETGVVGLFAVLWFLGRLLLGLRAAAWKAPSPERAWAVGFLVSTVLVFAVLYQFNQTLWRLDVWVLLALGWSTVLRAEKASAVPVDTAPGPLPAALGALT